MKLKITCILSICIVAVLFSCKQPTKTTTTTSTADTTITTSSTTITTHNRLGKATREDKNGWIYLHLSGSPADIGYQHGYLAAKEIDTLIKVLQYYLPSNS